MIRVDLKIRKNFGSIFDLFDQQLADLANYFTFVNDELGHYFEWREKDFENQIVEKQRLLKRLLMEKLSADNTELKNIKKLSLEVDEYKGEKNNFLQFLYQSLLSLLWSRLEGLLDSSVKLLEKEFGQKRFLLNKKLPVINILLGRINNYGLMININPELGRKIQSIRLIRNKFIHSLGGNIAEDLGNVAENDFRRIKNEKDIDYEFCLGSVETVRSFSEKIKLAFKEKYGN